MKQKSELETGLKVGDRVRLIAQTLPWRAEVTLQGQIGEVIERRDDGRITIRFDNGRLLMGRDAEAFERVSIKGRRRRGNERTGARRREFAMALVWGGAAGYDGHCIHRDEPPAIKLKPPERRRRGNERCAFPI